jgi:hypothetical protein
MTPSERLFVETLEAAHVPVKTGDANHGGVSNVSS